MVEGLKRWAVMVPVMLYSVILHEVAHGFVALLWGDPTALNQGRLTLNPLPHIDWLGSVLIPTVLILARSPVLLGWAKPVQYNPANFVGNVRLGILTVGLAGPATNLVLALLCAAGLRLLARIPWRHPVRRWIRLTLVYGTIWNTMLMILNFLPIPPLDGFRTVMFLFPALEGVWVFNNFYAGLVILAAALLAVQRFLVPAMTRVAEALLDWAEAPLRGPAP